MAQPDPPQAPQRQCPSPNPFGHADHSPFSAFGIELVYGLKPDGALAHVSAVPRGLGCECACPACGRTLVACKGPKVAAHFRHHGANTGCGRNGETNAHSWAKEVLGRELRILLPEVRARIGKDELPAHRERMFRFARAELEKVLDDIVPDVVLTTRDGQQLLVEVLVTHECGPEKIAKLRERELATLEIDLSAWRKSSDREAIEQALIERAPRAWLCNRKLDEAEEKLRADIAAWAALKAEAERQRQERAAADRRARADQLQRELDGKVMGVRRALDCTGHRRSEAGLAELEGVQRDELYRSLLQPRQQCSGFLVPAERWQAAILDRLVKVPIGERFLLPRFSIETAVRAIADCIHPALRRELAPDVQAALPDYLRRQSMPRDAIGRFLGHLCDQSMLQPDGIGGFEVADDRAAALEAAHAAWLIHSRRRRVVDRSMEKILQAIPAEERSRFSPERWQSRRVPGFDRTLDHIVESEPAVWDRFNAALMAIERMVEGGAPVAEAIGLPLEGELGRAVERIRLKTAQEAADRERRLGTAARDVAGARGVTWLHTPDPQGVSPAAHARASAAGLDQALTALERYRREVAAEDAAAALATACRQSLRTEAEKALGADLTPPFLVNYDARLKASPWDICVDASGLRLARNALALWAVRSKQARRR